MSLLYSEGYEGLSFDEIIKRRTQPGILIFNQNQEVVFINNEAVNLFKIINKETSLTEKPIALPDEVFQVCNSLKKMSVREEERLYCNASILYDGKRYSVRAVPLFRVGGKRSKPSHTMVIVESCTPRRNVDVNKVKIKFNLTKRETEVVEAIAKGFTNREIANSLCISEHTVKDYIKKIMQKLDVKCRTLIFCRVLE